MSSDLQVTVAADEAAALREKHYNATVIDRRDAHQDLTVIRVRPDAGVPAFQPGQYVAMGMGNWEPRLPGTQNETLTAKESRKLVRRAYSICCPMLLPAEQLAPCASLDFLEFYVTLVRQNVDKPPGLTPRLFCAQPDTRLWIANKIVGTYTLAGVEPEDQVIFLGTGTGEAPHNAMATELLAGNHRGPIVVATCVRARRDLAYLETHTALQSIQPNYRYLAYTTREAWNVDPDHAEYVGKQYLQDEITSGRFEKQAGLTLDPSNTHVFLCGNPDMIGYVAPGAAPPPRPGLLQVLGERGFRSDGEPGPGLVRFEKYW